MTTVVVGEWRFTVVQDTHSGNVRTFWDVTADDGLTHVQGDTLGPLWEALPDACDAIGIICPVVPDADLAWLTGLGEEESE